MSQIGPNSKNLSGEKNKVFIYLATHILNMSQELLEQKVIEAILEGNEENKKILLEQYKKSKISEREFSEVGFFTSFSVSSDSKQIESKSMTLGETVHANIPSLKNGAGFVLFIRNGKIDVLEGFTYGEKWPKKITDFEIITNE